MFNFMRKTLILAAAAFAALSAHAAATGRKAGNAGANRRSPDMVESTVRPVNNDFIFPAMET